VVDYRNISVQVVGGLMFGLTTDHHRLGTFAFPKEMKRLRDSMIAVSSETFSAVSAPIQKAAVVAYQQDDDPSLQQYLKDSRRILKSLSKEVNSNF
jgi:aspartate aminotransferase